MLTTLLRIGLCAFALGCGVEADAATAPAGVTQAEARAVLTVTGFTVTGSGTDGSYSYIPKLTLNEVTGKSGARVVQMAFRLLEVGATGNVPPYTTDKRVAAGASLPVFHELVYGDPEFEISSRAKSPRVSLVVTYRDDNGNVANVTAIVDVTWR